MGIPIQVKLHFDIETAPGDNELVPSDVIKQLRIEDSCIDFIFIDLQCDIRNKDGITQPNSVI